MSLLQKTRLGTWILSMVICLMQNNNKLKSRKANELKS